MDVLADDRLVWLINPGDLVPHAFRVSSTLHPTVASPGVVCGISVCGVGRDRAAIVDEAAGGCRECAAIAAAIREQEGA
jgi:hypothetical protein